MSQQWITNLALNTRSHPAIWINKNIFMPVVGFFLDNYSGAGEEL
ncbi:MAG TPA: hypothetical protein V6C65_11265 [Allocoleopsis sp.]